MDINFYTRLVYARKWPIFGRFAYFLLKLLGCEIPSSVKIGRNFHLVHGGFGVVMHGRCVIGSNVTIFHGVTLGRADTYRPHSKSSFAGIDIGDDAIIGPGAKILGTAGVLRVGPGSIVGANAVLQESTADQEVWAGIPARCVGMRSDPEFQ